MLTILHTNDFHNRLTVPQVARLKGLRDRLGTDGLLLDAGDAVGAGNITFHSGGEPILDAMTAIGYDAMTVGNREFHFSRIGFQAKLRRARFPVLCANVYASRCTLNEDIVQPSDLSVPQIRSSIANPDTYSVNTIVLNGTIAPILPIVPYIYREMTDGFRVVIIGLTVPMITTRMMSRNFSAYLFDDPLKTAGKLVAQLRSTLHPDLLIALTHIGIDQDRKLAMTVPGIDLIIGGHTHTVLEQGERVSQTLIVQAGSHGHYVGRIVVERDEAGDVPPRLNAFLEQL